jgi:hypothetical protein
MIFANKFIKYSNSNMVEVYFVFQLYKDFTFSPAQSLSRHG